MVCLLVVYVNDVLIIASETKIEWILKLCVVEFQWVAKLLYLAKRVWPDIIITLSFLFTRVKAPITENKEKLMHLLGYLQRTRKLTLILRLQKIFRIATYVDASFATRMDGKLHTDVMVMIGGAGVFFSS
jgi:hypothetical protein